MTKKIDLEKSWLDKIGAQFKEPYIQELKQFLIQEKQQGFQIFPKGKDIFSAFSHAPFHKVKVVILGQDPYHGVGQAHGLSFSVPQGITPPPSLKNIFKELENDIEGFTAPSHGNLSTWAEQGVFLLNAILTVRANSPGSHRHKGWETFTDATIKKLSDERTGLVFLLWGRYAQEKEALIDTSKHKVLKAPHPSPYSASSGFFGCKHFSKTNQILLSQNETPINWNL